MKIDRVEIDAFGHFEKHALVLTPGLNLMIGSNEAGKSTLLAFVRAVLFGFERRKSAARYEPEGGKAIGGALQLSAHFGPLRVRRRGGKRAEGELTVTGPDGIPLPETRLSDALAGISRELFFEVFAFGLNELASFERLANQGSVSEALFAAGIQGAQRLPAAVEALRQSAAATFAPRGVKPALNAVLDELFATRQRFRELGDRPAIYGEAAARLSQVEQELAALDGLLEKANGEKTSLERLAAVLPDLEQLAAAQAELAALPDLASFPEAGLARLEDLEKRLFTGRAERDEQAAKAKAVEEQLAFLSGGPRPGPSDEALRLALEAFNARLAQSQGLPGRRASMDERRRQLDRSIADLGLPLDGAALVQVDLGASARAGLVALRERSAEADRLLTQREESWKAARAARARAEDEVRRLTAEVAKLPSTPAAVVRRRQAALARLAPSIDDALRVEARRSELRAAAETQRALVEAPVGEAYPLWALVLCLFVLGGAVAAVFLAAPLAAGLAAIGGAVALSALLVVVQRRAAASFLEQLAASRARGLVRDRELARLAGEISALDRREIEARAAISAVSADAQIELGASAARVDALALELAHELEQVELRGRLAQDLEQHTARLAAAAHLEREAKADRDLAEAGQSKLSREVDALGAPRHFPRALSAAAALDLWNEAAARKARLLDLAAEEQAVRVDEEACRAAAGAVVAAASQAGLHEASSHGAEAAAQALGGLLGKGQEAEAERRRLLEKQEAAAAALARAQRSCTEAQASLEALLAQGQAADPEAFRARAAQAVRYLQAARRRREHHARIEAGAGLGAEEARARVRAAGGPEALAAKLAAIRAEAAQRLTDSKALADERGALRERVQGLERDQEVAALRLTEEALSAKAGELAARYATDRLALSLLASARRRFEDEQQPRVVKLASGIFGELTSGRYPKVYAAGAGKDLAIRDITGREWSAEKLSRGTRELLYFAFRLAVIEDFGQTRVALPVILDDILVNLDPERTRAAIAVLARLSRRHQVIAFTCHPALEPLFKAEGANLVRIAAEGQLPTAG